MHLARMDLFYDLIMRQIPSDAVSIVQKILLSDVIEFGSSSLLDRSASLGVFRLGNILGLSQEGVLFILWISPVCSVS